MKKILATLAMAFGCILSAAAMSYEEAREQALFLTDKMAYELNLNDEQYEYCYEINLDYLLSVETADDVYGNYLAYRNADLRHILFDWQYTIFAATDYFFHPLLWNRGVWTFPIYRYYTYGHYFYHRPHVYLTYHGGHGRFYYGGGYYGSRRPHWNGGLRGHDRGPVTRRSDFGRGGHGNAHNNIGHTRSGRNGSFGSTRSAHHDDAYGLGSQSHTRGNRTGSFGATRHSSDAGRSDIDHTRSAEAGHSSSFGSNRSASDAGHSSSFGNNRSASDAGHSSSFGNNHSASDAGRSSFGTSGHSVSNDARTGSFSRSSSNSYSHPSSTRSSSGANRPSIATRSSGSAGSMGGSRGGSSMGSRGGSSMGSHGGGSMGGSRGGHSGRGR